jgi:hypothetical protein
VLEKQKGLKRMKKYRIVSMLTKLVNRFVPLTAVHERVIPYNSDDAIKDEYEDEHKDD